MASASCIRPAYRAVSYHQADLRTCGSTSGSAIDGRCANVPLTCRARPCAAQDSRQRGASHARARHDAPCPTYGHCGCMRSQGSRSKARRGTSSRSLICGATNDVERRRALRMVVNSCGVSNRRRTVAVADCLWYSVCTVVLQSPAQGVSNSVTSTPTVILRASAGWRRGAARFGAFTPWAVGLLAASLMLFRGTAGSSPCPMPGAVAASSSTAAAPTVRDFTEPGIEVAVPTMRAVSRRTTSSWTEDDNGCADRCNLPQECTCPCRGTCVCVVGHSPALLAALSPHVAELSATRRDRPIVHVDRVPPSRGREPALRPPIA